MDKRKGFTLLELLVVIAIIVLLMAILIPALARVRAQTKAAVCQTNLKQWCTIFSMYVDDNDGYFSSGVATGWNRGDWIISLRSYFKEQNPKIRFCPMATKTRAEGRTGKFAAYNWGGDPRTAEDDYGSYGLNSWVYNPPLGVDSIQGRSTECNWRTIRVKGAGYIPLFADSCWVGGGPKHYDAPPEVEDMDTDTGFLGETNEMRYFCINRHDGFIDGAFLDSSVRKIGLKELWRLKWHRTFNNTDLSKNVWLAAPTVIPNWPEWMRKFPEYY